jgi:S-adenosylmethionine hydrolase
LQEMSKVIMGKTKSIVTLLTDFGTEDGYAGAMKGILAGSQSDVQIIDISHDIEPYNIRQAAFALFNYAFHYPDKSIHIVVIDPGVGSNRKGIVVESSGQFFIGPDNGVFSFVYRHGPFKAYEIDEKSPGTRISSTFHGRDVFAPAALKIIEGNFSAQTYPEVKNVISFYENYEEVSESDYLLKVIHVDHFGNLILNYTRSDWESLASPKNIKLQIRHCFLYGIKNTFSEVDEGQIVATWDSSGFLQISQYRGSAAHLLHMNVGDEVHLRIEGS